MGEPLAKFRLLSSVSGTDNTRLSSVNPIPLTKENKEKELSGGTPCKIMVVILN